VLTKVKAAALGNMAEAYYRNGNYTDARESFQAALALDPRSIRGWIGLGVTEQESGDLTGAVAAYSQAVKLQPSDVRYLLLAQALQQSGRASEAQAAERQAKLISQDLAGAQRAVDAMLAH
jgi:protein O-GlcNAc transferase